MKLVAVPALTIALAGPLGLTGVALQVAVLFNAVPTSASSYVFARALGGDHELMAAILTPQMVLAAVTLPLFLAWVGLVSRALGSARSSRIRQQSRPRTEERRVGTEGVRQCKSSGTRYQSKKQQYT